MAIPESQLETWSHQGSITQSSNTYNTVKGVLEANTTPYASKNFKVFLQGSYGNDTNIYAESDVDIVIRLDDCFYSDLHSLPEDERAAYKLAFGDATYTYADFKRDVLSVLQGQYGAAVKAGDKAIAIDANGSRRKSDVIVATQFRRYSKFRSADNSEYVEGICFFNAAGERIANYPRQHSANLTTKHQASSKWLKPVARVFKNMRSRMIDKGLIKAGIAPSYYIEGLLYNVPNEKLTSSYQDCVVNTLNWYRQEAQKSELVCANWQYYLLRDGVHTCWPQTNCDAFVEAAVKLWNGW
ncbi:nucleotidyltransferase domain-containing protein [Ralstonia holmesii]|uniref:Cyclic UMP-AMP synthase n=1 Tax=Ralstonia holmesii TaxID=3058602 RepID=A0ABC8QEJ3_9RALS|nr:nucleotidyltransferase [Ralstonia sp. LMG 32967]CAJ0797163.1 Cyclic UMP-AMP synthase [Ralstonia sp. LMG 32967]CAJ0806136.1 Cyclic UMP-AMP synthase [Ralstonia sp. LMG 32967]